MTGVQTLTARLILGVAAGIVGVATSSLPSIHRPSPARFRQLASTAFVFSRLAGFALIFLVFHVVPRGDIPAFYLPEASFALRGLLPYRDFGSSYAPLHAYVDGAALLLWHSPLAIILFAILVECLLFYLWLRIGPALFAERELRIAALLYLTSALSLQFVLVDGQDNVVIALLVLLATWALLRARPLASGALLGLGAVAVKLIPIFFAPVFFLGDLRRWRWSAGFLAVTILGYASFAALLHLPVLQPLSIEGALKSSGTIPYLVELAIGRNLPVTLWDAVMVLGLAALYLDVLRRTRGGSAPGSPEAILWGVSAAVLIMLLLANKSWAPYLMLCLFPLSVAVAARGLRARILLAIFGVVALAEKSYWATLLDLGGAQEVRVGMLRHSVLYLGFLPLQLLLLAGYVWLLVLCLDRLRSSPLAHTPPQRHRS